MKPTTILIALLLVLCLVVAGGLWLGTRNWSSPTDAAPPPEQQTQPTAGTVVGPGSITPVRLSGPVRFQPILPGRQLQALDYGFFRIGYDNQRKNPAWVVYDLDGPIRHADREPTRPATFATDFTTSAHVSHRDYTGSGFDRGHLCPAFAAWSRHGAEGFQATFIMSNIIPQVHALNAGLWEDLEDNIAGQCKGGRVVDEGYAGRFRSITVINGPIYGAQPDQLRNGTWIPEACFSIVLDYQEDLGTYRAMAFVMPNRKEVSGPLAKYLTTIKAIEQQTGIDVFAGTEQIRSEVEAFRASTVW